MIFKRKLRKIRERKAREKELAEKPEEEKKVRLSILDEANSSFESSSYNSNSGSDSDGNEGWRDRQLANDSPSILVKIPSKRERTMNNNKIRLFDEDHELSVIEENSYLYSRQSKNSRNELESGNSFAFAAVKASQDSKINSSRQIKGLSPSGGNKQEWNVDTPSNTSHVNHQDTIHQAEALLQEG